jgi:hypothetical protein
MPLTPEQVLALAPDAAAVKAARGLAATRHWQGLGQSDDALWGQCQGSALYQVRVELASSANACSCPSHKLPCKHALALLLLAATDAAAVPTGQPPTWVTEWLSARAARTEGRQTRAAQKADRSAADPAAQAKTAARRQASVAAGLANLDRWLEDLVRAGLGELETAPAAVFEAQAARLTDAKATALAGRVRTLAAIPASGSDWPERLLDELGRIALLSQAYGRLEQLAPPLREDVRQLIGWTFTQDEITASGARVADDWFVIGQWTDDDDPRMRTQRSWLLGARTGRTALVLQFSPRPTFPPFPQAILPGTHQEAELAFWPSAYPQRALIASRGGAPAPLAAMPHAAGSIRDALDGVAGALAAQPWLDRFPLVVAEATAVRAGDGRWLIRDRDGASLPLMAGEHWPLLAYSGGAPGTLAGEWNGRALRPLGLVVDATYRVH